MSWDISFTNEFGEWWKKLSVREQVAIHIRVALLAERGPGLGRPTVDTIATSRHANMKELRVGAGPAIRILFAFDPRQEAVLLLGGDKSGKWHEWYVKNVPKADDLFDMYLQELRDEGSI